MSINVGETILAKDGSLLGHTLITGAIDSRPLPNWRSDRPVICHCGDGSTILRLFDLFSGVYQERDVTSDWASITAVRAGVLAGAYIYILVRDSGPSPDAWRVYRYDRTNLAAGGTLMTFSGAVTLASTDSELRMTSDGTNFFFNYQAGNSANDYALAKYTLSGTTFTYSSTVNLGSTGGRTAYIMGLSNGDLLGQAGRVNYRYNSTGTLQATGVTMANVNNNAGLVYLNDFFLYIAFFNETVDGTTTTIKGLTRVAIP